MSGPTPGPWEIEEGLVVKRGAWIGRPEERRWAALACGSTDEEAEANARLIAAAPTMFDYIATRAALGDAEARKIMERINEHRHAQ